MRQTNIIRLYNIISLKNQQYINDENPIDNNCKCFTCLNYSRAYLRHLFANENTTSWLYLTVHNIIQTEQIIEEARESILNSSFESFKEEYLNG